MVDPLFILSKDDWSLHRKGEIDQERHRKKVREAIKRNLADLVSEEAIIHPQGDKIIKVPIRGLDEPKFRYARDNKQQVGQGRGGTKVGDAIGRAPAPGDGPGKGGGAGDQPGADYYEADVTIDELAELIFEDLSLPRLAPKRETNLETDDIRFNDVRRTGMMSNVDKRRTLLEAIKRTALSGGGSPGPGDDSRSGPARGFGGVPGAGNVSAALGGLQPSGPRPDNVRSGPSAGEPVPDSGASAFGSADPGALTFRNDDIRYKTWEDIRRPHSAAAVLAMMDTSGSMGTFEKYVARSFFFWMVRFLRTKYEKVDIRFLAHHTEASEVDEASFFTKGESGGTKCSSVYALANDIVEQSYGDGRWNVYAFHFSDGDNLFSDNDRTLEYVRKLLGRVNQLGYGEVRPRGGDKELWELLSEVRHPSFVRAVLRDKSDVLRALKTFFGEQQVMGVRADA